jgi:alpha-glucosidase (family GH31 glycosyl hydrolase)
MFLPTRRLLNTLSPSHVLLFREPFTCHITTCLVASHILTSCSPPRACSLAHCFFPGSPTQFTIPKGNLKGTYRQGSLDCYSTPIQCFTCRSGINCASLDNGLLSRQGWAVHDDTLVPRTAAGPGGWLIRNRSLSEIDTYLFAHGNSSRQFREALSDATAVFGKIALPPFSAFGIWWSREFAYSQSTLTSEVLEG